METYKNQLSVIKNKITAKWEETKPVVIKGIKIAGVVGTGISIILVKKAVNKHLQNPADNFTNWPKTASDKELKDEYERRRLDNHGNVTFSPAEVPKSSSPIPKTPEAKTTMTELMTETKETPRSYTPLSIPFSVKDHVRNLPKEWHASPEKIAEAESLGIELLPNQTLVDSYTKGVIVA